MSEKSVESRYRERSVEVSSVELSKSGRRKKIVVKKLS